MFTNRRKRMNAQDDKMMYRLFLTAVEKQVRSKAGPDPTIELGKVLKNNSVEFDTIMIREKDEDIVPNIFLTSYYRQYIEGRSVESIAEEIIGIYSENKDRFDMSRLGDLSFEFFKDRIFFKLVNEDMNRKLIEDLPYVRTGNLILIFACLIEHDPSGIASIRINNSLMKKWNIDVKTLLETAAENTIRLFPPKVFELESRNINLLLSHRLKDAEIEDLLEGEDLGNEGENDHENDREDEAGNSRVWIPDDIPAMFVLTNKDGVDGATCIVYRGLLERIKRRLGRGFYIIPSSVHEVLILPENSGYDKESLENIVSEVNSTVLSPMDILSENVYYYPDDCFAV